MILRKTSIDDAITLRNANKLNLWFAQSLTAIGCGEDVVLILRYINKQPEVVFVFRTEEDLMVYWGTVFDRLINQDHYKRELFRLVFEKLGIS